MASIWKRYSTISTICRYCRQYSTIRPLDKIRNIGISAHIDSGKTTVTERILFYAGRIDQMHEVKGKDKVGATMDFMDLERQRGITIQSAATYIDWKDTNINIIDTPGHIDFTVEVERALRVLDGAILVLCSVGGVQAQTYTVDRQMARYNVPFMAFINKLDRANASAHRTFDQIRTKLRHNTAMMQLPIGREAQFSGLVDLLSEKAIYFEEPQGLTIRYDEIPKELRAEAIDRRAELIEQVSNVDEELMELFLNDKKPTVDQVHAAIRRQTMRRKFLPVFMGTALKNKGVQPLLDAVLRYFPNPSEVPNYAYIEEVKGQKEKVVLDPARNDAKPFVGLAFKLEAGQFGQLTYIRVYQGKLSKGDSIFNTRERKRVRVQRLARMHANSMEPISEAYAGDICSIIGLECATGDTFTSEMDSFLACESMFVPEPVVSMAIKTKSRKDSDNFMKALTRFTKEDPTFRRTYDTELKETLVHGMGELHLEIYAQRMKNEFECEVELGQPKVAYRETLVEPMKFDYFHKKQTGGHGEYGRVVGIMEPLPPDQNLDFEMVDNIIGTGLPRKYIPSLEKGFKEEFEKGPLVGQKVVGVRIRLFDGAHHSVDSGDLAFIITAKYAAQDVYEAGKWQLLEPIMKLEVCVPRENGPTVMGSLLKRRLVTTDTNDTGVYQYIVGEVPLNEMFGFMTDLRMMTQGKGEYTMEYARYAPVPASVATSVIAKVRAEQEQQTNQEEKEKKKKRN